VNDTQTSSVIESLESRQLLAGTPYVSHVVDANDGLVILARNFDKGGEGVAYHDLTAANTGKQFRPSDGPDLYRGGRFQLARTAAGEWLNYTITVRRTGTYSIIPDYDGADVAKAVFHFELDGKALTARTRLTDPDPARNARLPAGKHTLRLVFDRNGAGGDVGKWQGIAIQHSRPAGDAAVRDRKFTPPAAAGASDFVDLGVDRTSRAELLAKDPATFSSTVLHVRSDGTADPAAGADGVLTSAEPFTSAGQTRVLPDGKILVVGSFLDRIVRLLPGGALDASFGEGGVVELDASNFDNIVSDVTVDSAGRILVAGTKTLPSGKDTAAVWRFTAAGDADTTFHGDGLYYSAAAAGESFRSGKHIVPTPDGDILLFASAGKGLESSSPVALRLNSRGAVERTFRPAAAPAIRPVVQTDGKVVILSTESDSARTILRRYTTAGRLDTPFATSGRLVIPSTGTGAATGRTVTPSGLAVLPDGHIALATTEKRTNVTATFLRLVRVTRTGAIDSDHEELLPNAHVASLAARRDGSLIAAIVADDRNTPTEDPFLTEWAGPVAPFATVRRYTFA